MAPPGPSLGPLTSAPDVDEEPEAAGWPAPTDERTDRAYPAAIAPDRRHGSTWAAPIATGRWGRPPAPVEAPAIHDLPDPASADLGPPHAPTRSRAAEQRLRDLRVPRRSRSVSGRGSKRRWTTASAELAVAIGVVVAVGVTTAGGQASQPPAPAAAAISSWGDAVPVLTNLIGDLSGIERDTSSAVNADPAMLASDASRLEQELREARGLPEPPGPAVAAVWSRILADLLTAQRTLAAAATTLSPATVALAHEQFALAGDTLLQVGQALRAG